MPRGPGRGLDPANIMSMKNAFTGPMTRRRRRIAEAQEEADRQREENVEVQEEEEEEEENANNNDETKDHGEDGDKDDETKDKYEDGDKDRETKVKDDDGDNGDSGSHQKDGDKDGDNGGNSGSTQKDVERNDDRDDDKNGDGDAGGSKSKDKEIATHVKDASDGGSSSSDGVGPSGPLSPISGPGSSSAPHTVIIERSTNDRVFKNKADQVRRRLTAAIPDIKVLENPEKPREGCFAVRDEQKNLSFISLTDMEFPYQPLKELDIKLFVEGIVRALKASK